MDANGEYTPTASRVGIDTPQPSNSYKLSRSQACINTINQWKAQADSQTVQAAQWFAQKQAAAGSNAVVLNLGVIFVQFADVPHYIDTRPSPTRPFGYFKSDFDSMLFSQNYWNGPQGNNKHPERDSIFGSMRDYYYQMSRGKLILTGTLLNPADANGVPIWLTLRNRANYLYPVNMKPEALDSARSKYQSDPAHWPNPDGFDKYIVIYAQADTGGYRLTHADKVNGSSLQVPERAGYQLTSPLNIAFVHIGTYCHEFGHDIGFFDEYNGRAIGYDGTDPYNYELMAHGLYNGPQRKGECPASISPYYRMQKNWVTATLIKTDTLNLKVSYSYENPNFYRINPIGRDITFDEYYVIETRLRKGFDAYVPTSPDQFPSQPGVLLIWHNNGRVIETDGETVDYIRLITADSSKPDSSRLTGFFPKDGVRQSFNDFTVPKASTLIDRTVTPPYEFPGHFALNGIHRHTSASPSDSNYTIIDTVATTVQRQLNTGWNMVAVSVGQADFRKSQLFPTATSPAYRYVAGAYVAKDTLQNGFGYWVKYASPQTVSFTGRIIDTLAISLSVGWNMIGSLTLPLATSQIIKHPNTMNLSKYWKYSGSYSIADTIKPGEGYWIKTDTAGYLALSIASTANNPPSTSTEMPGPPPESAPFAPISLLPADGATGVSITPTLSWAAAIGAESYDVEIYVYGSLVDAAYGIIATSYAIPAGTLGYTTPVNWNVRANNSYGSSAFTSSNFTTLNSTTAPTLTWLTNSSRHPELHWTVPSGVSSPYKIYKYYCNQGPDCFGGSSLIDTTSSLTYTDNTVDVADKNHPAAMTAYYTVKGTKPNLQLSSASNKAVVNTSNIFQMAGINPGNDENQSTVLITVLPTETNIIGSYPNPFNPTTTIKYQLAAPGYVRLSIFNILGEEIARLADGDYAAGYYSAVWDAGAAPSGIYFARITVTDPSRNELYRRVTKLLLMK